MELVLNTTLKSNGHNCSSGCWKNDISRIFRDFFETGVYYIFALFYYLIFVVNFRCIFAGI